ncbi:MAG: S8 family serine peptidase [Cyclobacteriaceae bacterium]|nr:S8 family serine peptidase [Cyclobacteriaceae bacterium]
MSVKHLLILLSLIVNTSLQAQVKSAKEIDSKYLNWHNQDYTLNKVVGISLDKAYQQLLNGKKPQKQIIVAVIDGGVDINHEDLKENIWVNEDEIANNGIDDDKNGYVDDIHGWNFLGNRKGENVNIETYEFIRIMRETPKDQQNTPVYLKAKQLYDKEMKSQMEQKESLERFSSVYEKAKAIVMANSGIDVHNADDLKKVKKSGDSQFIAARKFLEQRYSIGFTEKILESLKDSNAKKLKYQLSLEFDPRKIVGDNPHDITDTNYGNNDVAGPRADHGTAVAGVIAAIRNNNLGIDGIATHVKIMVIRTTPDGDERDKDVALGIRYAVENGAHIINMSFGKDLSVEKKWVDESVRLAEQKGVLLVHAAGNDGVNIDVVENYPSDRYLNGTEPANWIEVGASGQKPDTKLPASFSNYGQHVDLFAPGVNIASLDTANHYNTHDGTSLAAPVVSGVAALLMSYYPELTTQQIIQVLLQSGTPYPKLKVYQPKEDGKPTKVRFNTLSKTASILNAYQAIEMAERMRSGK